jgi:hypothetical protein
VKKVQFQVPKSLGASFQFMLQNGLGSFVALKILAHGLPHDIRDRNAPVFGKPVERLFNAVWHPGFDFRIKQLSHVSLFVPQTGTNVNLENQRLQYFSVGPGPRFRVDFGNIVHHCSHLMGKKTEEIKCRVEPAKKLALEDVARAEDLHLSDIVRRACTEFLAKQQGNAGRPEDYAHP